MIAGDMLHGGTRIEALDPDLHLPLTVLLRYLFFLSRRPISSSNRSFLVERVSGLRAMAAPLSNRSNALLDDVAGRLRRLTPDTLGDVMREISPRVTPLLPKRVTDDVIVTQRKPDDAFLASSRRIRLVLGPAIGIGDEAICLALPSWLRAAAPAAGIHVLSTRPELWSAVEGLASVTAYADHLALVEALRGDGFDLVFLADFERPALAPAFSRGPAPARYVELSIGARTLDALDTDLQCLHEFTRPSTYGANYYDFTVQAMRWLGTPAALRNRLSPIDPARHPAIDRPLTVVVSPFTSKHEPSQAAWSALLGALFPAAPAGSVRLVFDPGPGLVTERFACALAASTRAAVAPGIACDVASEPPARTLSLPGVLRLIAQADVVICADTFAAHVSPLSGCTTLVVASHSLANWRVPHAPAFYFDDEGAPAQIARGMRRVIAAVSPRFEGGLPSHPWCTACGRDVVAATAGLAGAVAAASTTESSVSSDYRACSALLRELVSELPDWPEDFRSLLGDRVYRRLLPPLRSLDRAQDAGARADLEAHVAHLLGAWENSNLYKYLVVAAQAEAV
jgi:hypothetical protein